MSEVHEAGTGKPAEESVDQAARQSGDQSAQSAAAEVRPSFDGDSAARLRRTIGRLARAMNQSASSEELTPTQASVLAVVAARDRIRLSALAQIEGLNPTMLSRVVGKLDELGLIERTVDERDQRGVVACATPAGRAKSQRIRELRTSELLRVIELLPASTSATLLAALPAFEELTDAVREPARPANNAES
ncbi:MAG TPA: MarR family winged helix-turn-helix transcriptional regulator [Pseudonocardia sp.]